MRLIQAASTAAMIVMLGISAASAADTNAQPDVMKDKSRAVAVGFLDKLRGQLMDALQAGGPTGAIEACQQIAPVAAEQAGEAAGATVRRTSLKLRNSKDAPDAWGKAMLEQFDARKAAGEKPATIEAGAWADGPQGRFYRYMKAIPTGEMCTQCHGQTIAPAVQAKLHELYPRDKATGFAVGDLRGAVSISWPATKR
jgi:hypothetical protein